MDYQAYFTMAHTNYVSFPVAFQMLANLMCITSDWEQTLLLEEIEQYKYLLAQEEIIEAKPFVNVSKFE